MKAVRMVGAGRPLEMQDVSVPEVGRRDVLVRVRAAGICHSDAHYRAGKSRVDPLPLTLGHEVAGIVEGVGEEVRERRVGDASASTTSLPAASATRATQAASSSAPAAR